MSNIAALGTFKLGSVQLGAQLASFTVIESLSVSDSTATDSDIVLEESLSLSDLTEFLFTLQADELISFFENIWYPALFQAGIKGRIVNPIDITDEVFCEQVLRAGQSLELDGDPTRAFIQIKQAKQKFDQQLTIFPGDAVMYACPDLVFSVGSLVIFNFVEYDVLTWIDRHFNGNIIFRKVALRRRPAFNIPMPKVSGVAASPNLEGKTTLVWGDVDKDVFPNFDHFNVYRALVSGGPYGLLESTKSTQLSDKNLVPNTPYYYEISAVDVHGVEGERSDEVVTPIDTVKPTTPTGGR